MIWEQEQIEKGHPCDNPCSVEQLDAWEISSQQGGVMWPVWYVCRWWVCNAASVARVSLVGV